MLKLSRVSNLINSKQPSICHVSRSTAVVNPADISGPQMIGKTLTQRDIK